MSLNSNTFYALPLTYTSLLISIKTFFQKISLFWCPVFKAASTNWMHNILHLAGEKEKQIDKIMKDHPKYSPQIEISIFSSFYHLSRLVSAYRDKLERCHAYSNKCENDSDWQGQFSCRCYGKYGQNIVRKYSKQAEQRFGSEYFLENLVIIQVSFFWLQLFT